MVRLHPDQDVALSGNHMIFLSVVSVELIVIAIFNISFGLLHQQHAPQPTLHLSNTSLAPAPPHIPSFAAIPAATSISLPIADPTAIRIPAINVSSPLARVGLKPDGSPEVPYGANADKAAWLTTSATPGVSGTSVIVGHVDTTKSGPSVFFNLGNLGPGQKIYIDRSNAQTAIFTVTDIQTYLKENFPSSTVYGTKSTPELRLITCGGAWDASRKEYTANIVVFAVLSGVE